MATCVGCGAELSPEWKFCIHCGIAADAHEIPNAIRSIPDDAPTEAKKRTTSFVVIGASAIVLGIVLLVLAIVYLAGALR
jgi:uncharacterized membrane protein YvbJ